MCVCAREKHISSTINSRFNHINITVVVAVFDALQWNIIMKSEWWKKYTIYTLCIHTHKLTPMCACTYRTREELGFFLASLSAMRLPLSHFHPLRSPFPDWTSKFWLVRCPPIVNTKLNILLFLSKLMKRDEMEMRIK